MQAAEKRIDLDPPAPHSPRLFGEMAGLPCRKAFAEKASGGGARMLRLRRMLVISTCLDAPQPVPVSTLVACLGISERSVRRLHKRASAMKMRRQRI